MVARQQHQQAGPWVAGEEEEDEAHQGLQGGKRTHVPTGEGGTGAAESTCWDPSLQHDENNRDFGDCRTWCFGGGREDGRTLAHGTVMQSWVPCSSSHWCPWSSSLHGGWDVRALLSCLAYSHGHSLRLETAGINHIYSFNNFKMSCLGADEEFLKKNERPNISLEKLKIKWKVTLNLEENIFTLIHIKFFKKIRSSNIHLNIQWNSLLLGLFSENI